MPADTMTIAAPLSIPRPLTPRDDVVRTGRDPVLKPLILSRGTLLTADLARARTFYEEFLGLECVMVGEDRMLVRDTDPGEVRHRRGAPYWIMDVKQAPEGVTTNLFKHWGIDVPTAGDVDRVYAFAAENKERLGLRSVRKVRMQHGTYSFYLQDFDSNWWEVECRPPGQSNDEIFARGDGAF